MVLPAGHGRAGPRPPPPGTEADFDAARNGAAPRRVLIVEDEAILAIELSMLVQRFGYEVCATASSERTALIAAEKHRPDLVLMDIRLAERSDGITAAAKIHDAWSIPSLFVTAHADPETHARAKAAGAIGFVHKPYSVAELHRALARALGPPPGQES